MLACGAAVAALVAARAHADMPHGNVVALDEVTVLGTAPARVRLAGGFLSYVEGGTYDAGVKGSIELVCPDGHDVECRAQATEILAARDRGDCIAIGWDSAPLTPGPTPASWPRRGIRALPASDPLCVRARAALPPPPPQPPPGDSPPRPPELPRTESYGRYLLMVDGINLVAAPLLVGIGGYLLAAPIVHLQHEHPGRAAISLGMRLAFPIVGGLTGSLFSDRCDREAPVCLPPAFVAGVAIGILTAAIVDAAVLGSGGPAPPSKKASLTPRIGLGYLGAAVQF